MLKRKNLVSIVIPNWNGREHLEKCFKSLEKLSYPDYEVILVDNGSKDDSVEFTKRNYPQIKIIQNKENLGFAEGNNIGYQDAKGEYILFLNNDTKVTPDFLTKLVNVMERDKKIGVVQPKIIFIDSKKLQAGGAFLTNTGFLYHYGFEKHSEDKKYNQQMEIFSANGSCMLVRKEVIEKVGLFDPDFFCYFEETDFCWRVWLAGYRILYIPNSIIYHKGGATASKIFLSFIDYHSFKNRICALIKNLDILYLWRFLPFHLFLLNLLSIFLFLTGKWRFSIAVQKAVWWNLIHIKKTLSKRKMVQNKIRKVSDKELMPKIKRKVRLPYYYYLFTGLDKYED